MLNIRLKIMEDIKYRKKRILNIAGNLERKQDNLGSDIVLKSIRIVN